MPALTAGQLTSLRSYPQRSNVYLVVQQPQYRESGAWTGYLWSAQINGTPGGTAGDLVDSLTVDNGDAGSTVILAGMTILIGTNKGDHDKGVYRLRVGQTATGATTNLDIGSTSEIVGNVEDDDWVVVLDEFRLWTRYPHITESGGVISWFKDFDISYASLGANADERREASLPPVPIMGPHVVQFVDLDGSVDVDFDWSDSYAMYPGAAINAWDADGVRGATSGDWSTAAQNPAAQTYDGSSTDSDNDISGLAGFRVQLILGTDQNDAPDRFRRGVRYVFTLRRPGEAVAGVDPPHAEPITDFEWASAIGSWDDGGWRTSITVFGSQAHEYEIMEGALTILFADDWYGGTQESVGPLAGRENIIMIGRIADGSVRENPETGDVTFEVVSASGQARNRDMYPIPIEYDNAADEWYKCPNLTVDRAAWFYITWHSTLNAICDWYQSGDTNEISAMDFLSGDIYSAIDSFYQDRLIARLLCDRYERFAAEIDIQIETEGAGTTIFTLADGDWLDELTFREAIETPVSIVELGGLNYDNGLITPYLAKAPGTVNLSKGRQFQNTSMALASQASLNTITGRLLAKFISRWPEGTIQLGNWRVFDVWPQEYVVVSATTQRHTFSSDNFIPRQVTINHSSGIISLSLGVEKEEGGVDGQTIDIPNELPDIPPPPIPDYGPGPVPTPDDPGAIDSGRRIVCTDVGVFATNEIGDNPPVWYAVNNGFVTSDDLDVWDIKRDPFHWWTSGGTERTLWAVTKSGLWKHEGFPYGTWTQIVTIAQLDAIVSPPVATNELWDARIGLSSEVSGRLCFVHTTGHSALPTFRCYVCTVNNDVITHVSNELFNTNDGTGYGSVLFAPHGAGSIIYAVSNRAPTNAGSGEAKLWRSTDSGASFSNINTISASSRGEFSSLAIPYISAEATEDLFIFWGVGGVISGQIGLWRESVDGGNTFTDFALPVPTEQKSLLGTGGNQNNILITSYDFFANRSYWTNDGQATWNPLPLSGEASNTPTFGTLPGWASGQLQNTLIGTYPQAAGQTAIYLWSSGQASWTDKTGNLNLFNPSEIRNIERDTMGSA